MLGVRSRKRLTFLILAFLGAALGTGAGLGLGRVVLQRSVSAGLSAYAKDLVQHADEYNTEIKSVFDELKVSTLPFCSPREIARLQAISFHSAALKDVGRTSAGKLYCSAFLGRLRLPYVEGPPAITLPDGIGFYPNVPLLLATTSHGTVIDSGFADVVLSPNSYDHWDRPHLHYMIVVAEPVTGKIAKIAGEELPVTSDRVLAQGEMRLSGTLYRSRCSVVYHTCVVTAESLPEAWSSSRSMLTGYAGLGALAGLSLGLSLGQFNIRRKSLPHQLRRAIRKDRLHFVYQPIVDLQTRNCVGAEALVRWSDEDGTPVAPDVFVRMAEEEGFIGELTALVIRRTTCDMSGLLREFPQFALSINIAAADLQGDELHQLLAIHVARAGIRPCQIALELTERSTANLDKAGAAIRRLRSLGYKVHLDDFGTGYSNLSYLHRLAVDAIKIDQSFTRTIGTDAATASVLPQILAMVSSLDINVIVEGVESAFQVDWLQRPSRQLHVQGWFFGRPAPLEGLREIVMQNQAENQIYNQIQVEAQIEPPPLAEPIVMA